MEGEFDIAVGADRVRGRTRYHWRLTLRRRLWKPLTLWWSDSEYRTPLEALAAGQDELRWLFLGALLCGAATAPPKLPTGRFILTIPKLAVGA